MPVPSEKFRPRWHSPGASKKRLRLSAETADEPRLLRCRGKPTYGAGPDAAVRPRCSESQTLLGRGKLFFNSQDPNDLGTTSFPANTAFAFASDFRCLRQSLSGWSPSLCLPALCVLAALPSRTLARGSPPNTDVMRRADYDFGPVNVLRSRKRSTAMRISSDGSFSVDFETASSMVAACFSNCTT